MRGAGVERAYRARTCVISRNALLALLHEQHGHEVAQQPRAGEDDHVQVRDLVLAGAAALGHEEVNHGGAALRVVGEDEERPVQQPRALLHDLQVRLLALPHGADEQLQVLARVVPEADEDVGGEAAPERLQRALLRLARARVRGGAHEQAVVVEVVRRHGVLAGLVAELGALIERLDVLGRNAVVLGQVVHVEGAARVELLEKRRRLVHAHNLADERAARVDRRLEGHLVLLHGRLHLRGDGRLLAVDLLEHLDGELRHACPAHTDARVRATARGGARE